MYRPVRLLDRRLGHCIPRRLVNREGDNADTLPRVNPGLALVAPVFIPPGNVVGLGIV